MAEGTAGGKACPHHQNTACLDGELPEKQWDMGGSHPQPARECSAQPRPLPALPPSSPSEEGEGGGAEALTAHWGKL